MNIDSSLASHAPDISGLTSVGATAQVAAQVDAQIALDDALCSSALAVPEGGGSCEIDELWRNGLDGGDPTPYGVEVYTAGDCWLLAWHVARTLSDRGHAVRLMALGWPRWEHVVVRVGRGLYLDAMGLHSRDDLETQWGRRVRSVPASHTTSFGAFRHGLDAEVVYEFGHAEAAAFAERLIDRWLGSPVRRACRRAA